MGSSLDYLRQAKQPPPQKQMTFDGEITTQMQPNLATYLLRGF
jgi:hypothetical protein